MKGEMSGFEVSADVALIARAETLPTVPWLKRISPALPGSAIVVELSNVYLNAVAPAAPSARTACAVAVVLELAAEVAEAALLAAWCNAEYPLVSTVESSAFVAHSFAAPLPETFVTPVPPTEYALEENSLSATVPSVFLAQLLESVAEVEAALALEAAAVWLVVALAASTNRTHLAASVLLEIGWDPDEVWATIQR